MADVVPCEILIRLRHPKHEADKLSTYHASIQEWLVDMDGKPVPMPEKGPFPPAALDKMGFSLDDLMQAVAVAALRDHEIMRVQTEEALKQKNSALTSALEEKNAAVAERDAATAAKVSAEATKDAAVFDRNTLAVQVQSLETSLKTVTDHRDEVVATLAQRDVEKAAVLSNLTAVAAERDALAETLSKKTEELAAVVAGAEAKSAVDPT